MTELMQKAFTKAASLPETDQDAIATRLLEQLEELADEHLWAEKFARSQDWLAKAAKEALDEHNQGETRPLDELLEER